MRTYFKKAGRTLLVTLVLGMLTPMYSYGQTDFLAEPDYIAPDGFGDELASNLDFQDDANAPSKKTVVPTQPLEKPKPKSKSKPASSAILQGTVQGLSDKNDGLAPALKKTVEKSNKDSDDFEKATGKKPTIGWKIVNLIENTFFNTAPVILEKVILATVSVLLTRLTV